ncbi:MAG: arylsulfatase [Candidatus Tyrphobacter sp.]
MPHAKFGGTIRTTATASLPWWPPAEPMSSPNVLMVVLDDTGWSDLGCFGSEIATPAMDRLAYNGLRYTNFHVTPLCSPTRASLLTGRNHHAIGMRFLSDTDTGFPNSRGRVDRSVPMLPKMLRDRGYGTYLAGKWHLTPAHEITPAGPFEDWPLGRGFDRFYGFLGGCVDQYSPELCRDNHQVTPPRREDYHLSEDIVENALAFLLEHVTYRTQKPFFLELAFGATHAPFQAPQEYIAKYAQVFAKGWDETRDLRLERQIAAGLVPAGTSLTERNPGVPAWSELSVDERTLYAHLQAAFAGFLEHADAQLGRLIEGLSRLGLSDDTIVIVLSDNGASREGGRNGAVDVNAPYSGVHEAVREQLPRLARIGSRNGPAHYPEGWGMAGNTPFRRYKQYVDLGGIRSPLIVSWPKGITARNEIRTQFVHAIDIVPTLLEMLGIERRYRLDGASIGRSLADPSAPAARETQYWEMLGHRALWRSGWKAVTEHVAGADFANDRWRLYDTKKDFSEARDLAAAHSGRLRRMQRRWWREARRNGVLPLDDRPLADLLALSTPLALSKRSALTLRPLQEHVPATTLLGGSDRSLRITAVLKHRTKHDEGVLLASGGDGSGYVLYVLDNRLVFEHVVLGVRTTCASDLSVPEGDCSLRCSIDPRENRSADVRLFVNGELAAAARIPRTLLHLSFWGIDVGRDRATPVSTAYPAEFPFSPHVLERVTIEFPGGAPAERLAEEVRGVE